MKVLLTNVCDLYNKGEVALVTSVAKNLPDSEIMLVPTFSFIDADLCKKLKIDVYGRLKPFSATLFLVWSLQLMIRAIFWSFFKRAFKANFSILLTPELKAYARTDLIVDLGGDTFSDDYGFRAFCTHFYGLLLGIVFKKPFFVCSQTIGPFKNPVTRFFAKTILERADMITVREPITLRYLQKELKIKQNNNLKLVPDLAFLLEGANPLETEFLIQKKGIPLGKPIIGINPSNLIWRYMFPGLSFEEKYTRYIELMANMIDTLPENTTVIMIPNVTGRPNPDKNYKTVDDRIVIHAIYDKLNNKKNVYLIEENLDPHQTKGVLGMMDLFIGCRMHAVISALSSGTTTIALSYSYKTLGIVGELLGLNEIIIDVRNKDNKTINLELLPKIIDMWNKRVVFARELARKRIDWRKQAYTNIQLTKKLYVANKIKGLCTKNLCNNCGNCAFVCPNKAIMQPSAIDGQISFMLNACNGCGLCLKSCPKLSSELKVTPQTDLLGVYDNCWVGQSVDRKITRNATSGGIVTSLLVNAINQSLIDGALVTRSQGVKSEAFLGKNVNDLLSSSGSKYCPVNCTTVLKEIAETPGKYAVVGLPCQIRAIKKLEALNKNLSEKIVLHIGLFCSHNVSFNGTTFLLNSMGISLEDVADLQYRARKGNETGMLIRTKNGKERFISSKKYWMRFFNFFFVPFPCLKCSDLTSELADISVGDAWLPEYKLSGVRHCIFITRNQVGSEMVESAISRGLIKTNKINSATVVKSQKMHLHLKKRELSIAGILALGYLALVTVGSIISIKLQLRSLLKVFLRFFRVIN